MAYICVVGNSGFIVQFFRISVHVQKGSEVGDFPSIKRSTALVSLLSGAPHCLKALPGIPQGRHASLRDHSHSLTTRKRMFFGETHGRSEDTDSVCICERELT